MKSYLLPLLTGLLFAKLRYPWFLMMPLGVVSGTVVVLWQSASLADIEGSLIDRLGELFTRLDAWYEAATTGGISTDLMPFSILLISSAWILGFFSSWFIFKNNNIWFAVVFGGTAMLTNLSFLPERFSSRFFIFVLVAMILVVRMSIVQRHEIWRRVSFSFSTTSGWLTLHATLWFSIVVIVVAAVLPLKIIVSQPIAEIWTVGRTPVASIEEVFVRLFSTIPSRMDTSGRFFGKTLPFMGKISFGGDVVAWTTSEYPSYWLSQAYNHYTAQGWIATETEPIEIGPDILPPPMLDSRKRTEVNQTIQLGFDTRKFLTGGSFDWVNRSAVAESLAPRKFVISIKDDSYDADYPEDIQTLSAQLRNQVRLPSASGASSFITGIIPNDLLLLDIQEDNSGQVEFITLQRKAPISPDLVAWQFTEELPENLPYSMVSFVSVATNDDLRDTNTDYNRFITDHYLQLPSTLPQRVRDLAETLTANAATPFDKAVAVQDYLRGPEFVYSQDIDAPPRNADGVDYFLFDSKIGYSDYFGSSMAVLMRAAGVPARLAAGYAPGELDETSGQRFIKDSDSHGWVQVYFPEYGWIDFEPTPNWDLQSRSIGSRGNLGASADDGDLDPDDDIRDNIDLFAESLLDDPGVLGGSSIVSFDVTPYIKPALIALGTLIVLFLIFQVAWNFGLGSMTIEERIYTKMGRLGWMAGTGRQPQQTPWEYAAAIGLVAVNATEGARKIASQFAISRYGHQEPDENELEELGKAWKNVRMRLIGRAFRRIIPQPSEQPQQAR
ncbi:MAG: DUF4129 domain-containing protein [Chloroflexi bacterium]|nr:DUF4129 domain-containing protein [Chloroflexota bacterium]